MFRNFGNIKINRMIAEHNDCLAEYKEASKKAFEKKHGYIVVNNSPTLEHSNLRIAQNLFCEDKNCPYVKFTVS